MSVSNQSLNPILTYLCCHVAHFDRTCAFTTHPQTYFLFFTVFHRKSDEFRGFECLGNLLFSEPFPKTFLNWRRHNENAISAPFRSLGGNCFCAPTLSRQLDGSKPSLCSQHVMLVPTEPHPEFEMFGLNSSSMPVPLPGVAVCNAGVSRDFLDEVGSHVRLNGGSALFFFPSNRRQCRSGS